MPPIRRCLTKPSTVASEGAGRGRTPRVRLSVALFPQGTPADASQQRVQADHTRAIFDAIAGVIRAAQEAGEVRRDIPALQVAEMYVSIMLMTIRLWLVDYWRDGVDLEKRVMRALSVLEAGLASRPAARGLEGRSRR